MYKKTRTCIKTVWQGVCSVLANPDHRRCADVTFVGWFFKLQRTQDRTDSQPGEPDRFPTNLVHQIWSQKDSQPGAPDQEPDQTHSMLNQITFYSRPSSHQSDLASRHTSVQIRPYQLKPPP